MRTSVGTPPQKGWCDTESGFMVQVEADGGHHGQPSACAAARPSRRRRAALSWGPASLSSCTASAPGTKSFEEGLQPGEDQRCRPTRLLGRKLPISVVGLCRVPGAHRGLLAHQRHRWSPAPAGTPVLSSVAQFARAARGACGPRSGVDESGRQAGWCWLDPAAPAGPSSASRPAAWIQLATGAGSPGGGTCRLASDISSVCFSCRRPAPPYRFLSALSMASACPSFELAAESFARAWREADIALSDGDSCSEPQGTVNRRPRSQSAGRSGRRRRTTPGGPEASMPLLAKKGSAV